MLENNEAVEKDIEETELLSPNFENKLVNLQFILCPKFAGLLARERKSTGR